MISSAPASAAASTTTATADATTADTATTNLCYKHCCNCCHRCYRHHCCRSFDPYCRHLYQAAVIINWFFPTVIADFICNPHLSGVVIHLWNLTMYALSLVWVNLASSNEINIMPPLLPIYFWNGIWGKKMGTWPVNSVFVVKCPFFSEGRPFSFLWNYSYTDGVTSIKK